MFLPSLRRRLTATAAALVVGSLALTACGDSADETTTTAANGNGGDDGVITITGVPAEEATALVSKFELLMEVISEETGKEVEFSSSTDYAAVIEALVAGQADMAIGSPFSYVRASKAGAELEPLGGRIEEEGDEPGYVSYALVRPGSDIRELADAKDRTVCYVDQGSTSGFLYPSAGMIEAGLDPEGDVDAIFSGSHDAAVLALLDETCDMAFAYDSMVEVLMPGRGELNEGDYEVIWESPLIPASPIYMNTGTLDQETQDKLRTMFREDRLINVDNLVERGYCDSLEDCTLPEDSYEYAPVDDSTYDGIREVCELTQAAACTE
ncbi:MAG: phosphate/phosphite/phosphonate ABC transporter substrate-binding protein [Corynebacterium sp.]|uniref:phosphate/phosphite/phosphonate ABC transporter substrate-binding protein n=1 Tax=Corynebacterium sp. TaxID=1720 RepID=UPI0026DF4A2C|nr:phosphate/phosphite/phosphonate ABC transporter substrate-binding protein [Corynebacterium sp.]MDO5670901.1 phosphate/phosphite/phosphonate ABC transporter substrate-binding protein [Corynebacterium sp.]